MKTNTEDNYRFPVARTLVKCQESLEKRSSKQNLGLGTMRFLAAASLTLALCAQAQWTLSPMTTFGGGDGWKAPGEGGYLYLGTSDNERGVAYRDGKLYLVSGNNIRILDATNGTDIGSLNTGGISGGLRAINMIAAPLADARIFACNLTTNSSTSPFKIYAWFAAGSPPSTLYSGTTRSGARIGDSFDAETSALFGPVAFFTFGYGNVAGYGLAAFQFSTMAADVQVPGTAVGDFRLGISFGGPPFYFPPTPTTGRVLGTQGGGNCRITDFSWSGSSASGSLLATDPLTTTFERPLDFANFNNVPHLATIDTASATVRVYSIAVLNSSQLLGSGNNTTGPLALNTNGTGSVAWGGDAGGGRIALYALSSNHGIQAFHFLWGSGNEPPMVNNPIPDTNGVYGTPFTFQFAADTFTDTVGDVLTYSASALPGVMFTPATRTFSGTPTTPGSYLVNVVATDDYPLIPASTNDTFSVVIDKAPLTVTAHNTNRLYNESNPQFTGVVTGLVNGDNITATFSTTATPASLPGQYPIQPTLTDPGNKRGNYVITTNIGTLTINCPPTLLAAERVDEKVILKWTNNCPWVLTCNTNVDSTDWTAATPPPALIGNLNVVTNSTTEPQKFYRLRSP